jgi:hypothetical protein
MQTRVHALPNSDKRAHAHVHKHMHNHAHAHAHTRTRAHACTHTKASKAEKMEGNAGNRPPSHTHAHTPHTHTCIRTHTALPSPPSYPRRVFLPIARATPPAPPLLPRLARLPFPLHHFPCPLLAPALLHVPVCHFPPSPIAHALLSAHPSFPPQFAACPFLPCVSLLPSCPFSSPSPYHRPCVLSLALSYSPAQCSNCLFFSTARCPCPPLPPAPLFRRVVPVAPIIVSI